MPEETQKHATSILPHSKYCFSYTRVAYIYCLTHSNFNFVRAAFTGILTHQMGMLDQVSHTQAQNLAQQQQQATMISLLQGMTASQQELTATQQQTNRLLAQLLAQQQGQGNQVAVVGVGAAQAPPQEAPAGVGQGGADDGHNHNNNGAEVQQPAQAAPATEPIPDVRAHEPVGGPPIRRTVVRNVNNTLVEGGVALVTMSGCPKTFKFLVEQWEVQRLGRFVAPLSRRPFSGSQKNAWTKWSRLYNMVLHQADFDQLRHGQSPFPRDMTRVEIHRRLIEAADYYDSQRRGDSMDKFYKEVRGNGQRAGDLTTRVRNGGIG
jgi:hypothetical protein